MGTVGAYLGNSTAVEGVGKSRQILRAEGGLRALPQEVMWAGAKREKAPHPVRLCISFGLGS